jgi:hypothetical protein
MSSTDTSPTTTEHEPTDDAFTSPAFRQELERLAPELVEKFDLISCSRSEELGVAGRMYHEAKSDLIRLQEATILSDESDIRDNYAIKYMTTESGSMKDMSEEDVNTSPVTSTDSTNSSAVFGPRQELVRNTRRIILSDSASSSVARSGAPNSSGGFDRPQEATRAKKRIALSTSTTSPTAGDERSNSSAGSSRPQATVEAKKRVVLSTSSKGSSAGFERSNPPAGSNRPQVAVKAKNRVALSTSSKSPSAVNKQSNSSASSYQPQAAVKAKNRIVLSDATASPKAVSEPSKSSVDFEQAPVAVESESWIALTNPSNDDQGSSWSHKARNAVTTSEALVTIQIQIRLLPVLQILKTSDLTPSDRLRARDLAQSALQYANDCEASLPLAARCSFYIAHTYYDRDDKTTLRNAVAWFERATEASEADYPEGQWAQEWLNHYESVRIDADSRPSTAESWGYRVVNSVWSVLSGGARSTGSSSAAVSPSAPKPPTNPSSRLYSNSSGRAAFPRLTTGERLPSFASSTSPSSGTSTGTKDHHGLKWSPNSPFGKGEILHGQRFPLVQSPEPIDPIAEEDENEEEKLPEVIYRSNLRYRPPRRWADSDFEVPDYMLEKKLRIMNASSPPESPNASSPLSEVKKQQSPTSVSSYFAPALSPHRRVQSFAAYPTPPVPVARTDYAQSEGPISPTETVALRMKKRGSLSLLLGATGLDIRRRRDEAAQMEEGESPAFAPKKEEEGFYRRRSNDIIEYEEV